MAARASSQWDGAAAVAAQADKLRLKATQLAEEDAQALEAALAARDQAETRQEARDFVFGRALARAADVPLAIADAACDVALLAETAADHVNGDVRADAAAAALLAAGAAAAAAHLVAINLASLPDDARVRAALAAARSAAEAAARVSQNDEGPA